MTDIVERLRAVSDTEAPYANDLVRGWCHEAADEIERLRAANTELQGIDATLQLALERAQRERDEATARAKELKRDLIKARVLVISEGVRLSELVEKAERERDEARAALSKRTECRSHQFSDLMICEDCGLEWDTNDPAPPECPRAALPPPEGKP